MQCNAFNYYLLLSEFQNFFLIFLLLYIHTIIIKTTTMNVVICRVLSTQFHWDRFWLWSYGVKSKDLF